MKFSDIYIYTERKKNNNDDDGESFNLLFLHVGMQSKVFFFITCKSIC